VYLADTSAWNRSRASRTIALRWARLIDRGELALCAPVELELLSSATSSRDYREREEQLAGLARLPLNDNVNRTALRVQASLAAVGQHRGPKPVDLLIAAVAQVNDVVLLHYDHHFDLIARATEQPMEWLARRGSVD
jgi:predicted nucleic acid-binding protein